MALDLHQTKFFPAAAACLGLALAGAAQAQQAQPGFATSFWTRATMLGDLGGIRTGLGNHGVTLGLAD